MSTCSSELRDARMHSLSPSALTISLPISPAAPDDQYLAQSRLLNPARQSGDVSARSQALAALGLSRAVS